MTVASAWLVAAAVWLGCLAPTAWWTAGLAGAVLTAVTRLRSDRVRLGLVLVALALLGSGSSAVRVDLRDGGLLPALAQRGGAATVVAVVASEPRDTVRGQWLLLRVTSVDAVRTRERALVLETDRALLPALGSRVGITVTARPLRSHGLDGHARRLGAATALTIRGKPELLADPPLLLRSTGHLRERLRAAAGAHLAPELAPLLTGLTTGDLRGLPATDRGRLADAGLTHLVVVSGRHVALLLGAVLALLHVAGAGARGRRLVCLAALAWFVVLVRWQPSVLRAGLMAALIVGAGLVGRRHDARHVLAVGVILLLLGDPLLAAQPGFALSVLATGGILLFAPALQARMRGPRWLRAATAVAVAAQLGAGPVLLLAFGQIPAGSVPANLVAVPAAAAGQVIGLIVALVAVGSVPAAALLAVLSAPFLMVIRWSAATFGGLPALTASSLVSAPAAAVIVALALRRRAPRAALGSAVVALLLVVGGPLATSPPTVTELTVTMMDVGQGDAVLVEAPAEDGTVSRMLVDGGPDEEAALAQLRRLGIRALDVVVLTHAHHDHAAGLPAVLEALPVGAMVVGPVPLDPARASPTAAQAEATARARGVPVLPVAAGQGFVLGGAEVEVLAPPAEGFPGATVNDQSVVLRAGGAAGVLLTGDAEVASQTWLLRRPDTLRAAILKVPHHGGDTNAPGFLAAVAPRTVLIGVGGDNDYGHPHPDVISALRGTDLRRTDQAGTIRITAGPLHSRADAPPARLPARRSGGAPPAPSRRPAAGRGPCGRDARRDRRPRQRARWPDTAS